MTSWTPELERLIREFGEIEEQNTKDGCNPNMSMVSSMLRIAYRSATKSQPLFKSICSKMGVKPDYETSYTATLQKMADLAMYHNSDAADKLRTKIQFTQELNERFPNMGGIARIKAAKKGKILYPC